MLVICYIKSNFLRFSAPIFKNMYIPNSTFFQLNSKRTSFIILSFITCFWPDLNYLFKTMNEWVNEMYEYLFIFGSVSWFFIKETFLQGENIGKRQCTMMTSLFPEISLESHVSFQIKKKIPVEQPTVKSFREPWFYYCFLTMVEQMGLSMRVKAVKVSDTGCCLGTKGTKCLSSGQHFPSPKGW